MTRIKSIVAISGTVAAAAFFMGPIVWIAMASVSTNQQININPLGVGGLHLENYSAAWTKGVGQFVINSLLIAGATTVAVCVIATLAGYSLGRLRFPGRKLVESLVLLAIAAPVISYVIELQKIAIGFQLLDLRTSVVVADTATFVAVPTLIIASFFRSLPSELVEAARLDGAREWQAFLFIMAPLVRPAILVAAMFVFVWSWNDILMPVVMLQSPDKYTIPQGVDSLRSDAFTPDFARLFAASLISTVPMILLYRQLQRHSIEVIRAGAMNG